MAMEIQITRRAGYAKKIKTPAELHSRAQKIFLWPPFSLKFKVEA
jgi:hypothetical protein